DGTCPEGKELRDTGIDERGHPGEYEEQPTDNGREMEDRHELVDRGVVGALLVAAVQPVESSDQDPGRQCGQEGGRFDAQSKSPRSGMVEAEQELRDKESEDQSDHVGAQEHSSNQPSSPSN